MSRLRSPERLADSTVVHGAKRGRAIGIPTANIAPASDLLITPGNAHRSKRFASASLPSPRSAIVPAVEVDGVPASSSRSATTKKKD